MKLILVPLGCRAHIFKPRPYIYVPPDDDHPFGPETSCWLVQQAVDRYKEPSLRQVRAEVRPLLRVMGTPKRHRNLMVEVHIQLAMDHPWTPFAIRYTSKYRDDMQPFALWRGEYYTCERDGSLTPWGQRDPYTPTPEKWAENRRIVRKWLAARP